MAVLKSFCAPVIYNCLSSSNLIKPNPILFMFMPIGIHVCLFMHAWV